MSKSGWHPNKLFTSPVQSESTSTGRTPVARENVPNTPRAGSVQVDSFFVHGENSWDFDIEWELRSAEIVNPQTGKSVFKETDLEFPKSWSQNCTALVSEKYFRYIKGPDGTRVKEKSVNQMVDRVSSTITDWGVRLGYFELEESSKFYNELGYILSHQLAAFNSPVWFNVGVFDGELDTEQCSACFINSIEDDMKSILQLGITEGTLYKHGSGSGVNYSSLRSSKEPLSAGGYAGGPVPFIMKDDFNAGAIQSGGTTRRAAKMAILNIDHPDVMEFIQCKANGEKAAHALIDSGAFTGDFRDRWGAYKMVPFQNANHSIRVTDDFMRAVTLDNVWELKGKDGIVYDRVKARDLWMAICEAAHFCGDPGLQFDTTVNKWHTSPATGRINSSNPCSEYMFLDDSACNLASINLLKFLEDDEFSIDAFRHTVDIMTTAMEIIVGAAGYPTEKIKDNSHKFRPLGLGFSNLGAFLMSQGLPYDSDVARAQAGMITAIITGRAYSRSAEIAEVVGPFEGYSINAASMMGVMEMHRSHVDIPKSTEHNIIAKSLKAYASEDWDRCIHLGSLHGYRNAQASVIAPAGTISFMMDCDTTGIEPDLSLKKTKKLVGGGTIQIVNQQVGRALDALEYSPKDIENIIEYVNETGSVIGCDAVNKEDVNVFLTSFPDPIGGRYIPPHAHVKMMAAVQPFVSGAISKTVNMPHDATVDDISDVYKTAWEMGIKAIALYRDGCKRTQPLSASQNVEVESDTAPEQLRVRRKLPNDCMSQRHRFQIGHHSGYLHVGVYPDGKPGELFLRMAKEGSTVSGLMDTIGVLTSIALQYGVPLEVLVNKFSYTQFEPSGMTNNEDVRFAKSPVDYIFRFLKSQFLDGEIQLGSEEAPKMELKEPSRSEEGHVCGNCGNSVQRAGACLSCSTCGWTEGCG